MFRFMLVLVYLLACLPSGFAQTPDPKQKLPGLKLEKVPDVVYSQLPNLPVGRGILVVNVAPGSPAAKAGLIRHDILLSVGDTAISDTRQFIGLAVKMEKAPLVLLRAGKEVTLHLSLNTLAQTAPIGPMAIFKPGGPPSVTVEAKQLQGNQLSVTFTYYSKGNSKLESVTCNGSLEDIKQQVKGLGQQKRMSPRVQDLADLALDRLRVLNSPAKK